MIQRETWMKSLFWIWVVACLSPVSSSQADTIRVGGDQADYETIQEGVAAASDGDTILIGPGVFTISETIRLDDKSIRFIGSGIWRTILNGSGSPNEILFHVSGNRANGCHFEGIHFHGVQGNCLRIEDTECQIVDCWFVNIFYPRDDTHYWETVGGAIQCRNSAVEIELCLFLNCATEQDEGGAINIHRGKTGTAIKDCYFIGNSANESGGAVAIAQSKFQITSCYFENNSTDLFGGAIALAKSGGTIDQSYFTNNTSLSGGVLRFDWDSENPIQILNCDFLANEAYWGGALYGRDTSGSPPDALVIEGNSFEANMSEIGGGAIRLTGITRLQHNRFAQNVVANGAGGAIWLSIPQDRRFESLITDNAFVENEAELGGAMFIRFFEWQGPWLLHHLRLERCLFLDNLAKNSGGCLFVQGKIAIFTHQCQYDGNSAPFRSLFFNSQGSRISLAGCQLGTQSMADFGDHCFIGPANHFDDEQPPTRIVWDLQGEIPVHQTFPSYWPIVNPYNSSLTRSPLVDIPHELDAFAFLPDGDILFSVRGKTLIPGLTNGPRGEWVNGEDIVRFRPTGYGAKLPGKMEFYFDGSDVGLSKKFEDLDALAIDDEGRLYLSTRSGGRLPKLGRFNHHSIMRFTPTTLGAKTSGQWEHFIDGNEIGLNSSRENIDGLDLLPTADGAVLSLLVSVTGQPDVPGLEGEYAEPQLLQFDATYLRTNDSEAPTTGSWKIFQGGTDWVYPSSGSINYAALID